MILLKTWHQNKNLLKIPKVTPINLYKGLSLPLFQLPIICSVTFGVEKYSNLYITNNHFISGSISGFIGSIFVCPFEYFKIQKQQQIIIKYSRNTFLNSFKDINITLMREVPAYTLYFSSYNFLKKNDIPTFVSGGIAGTLTWLLTYPQDTIKSRLQSGQAKTIIHAYKMGNLWCGVSFCLMRAFIVNAIGFPIYENLCY